MENDKDEYLMIDHTIELDVSKLPKLMQNTIADLEEYEKQGEWVMYDGLADGLESVAKSALLQNVISEAQFNQILKKYRGGLWNNNEYNKVAEFSCQDEKENENETEC